MAADVLSRIAESLYWIGRYTERAEDTARLLDVANRSSLEGGDAAAWDTAAEVLGPVAATTRRDALAEYALDRTSATSIAASVRTARENARTVREAVTSEMWEALNTWHLAVAATGLADLEGGGVHRFFSSMKEKAFLFTGTADGTMLREEGWQWLTIGRFVERILFTCRVLGARSTAFVSMVPARATPAQTYGWTALLRSLSAYDAYRKTYRDAVEPRRVAEFLLLDGDFPRSCVYGARHVETGVGLVTDRILESPARLAAGRLRADLEFLHIDDVFVEGVGDYALRVSTHCHDVHDRLTAQCFARGPVPAPAGVVD
jgi:uncharacterized alpha-E superfamily protein